MLCGGGYKYLDNFIAPLHLVPESPPLRVRSELNSYGPFCCWSLCGGYQLVLVVMWASASGLGAWSHVDHQTAHRWSWVTVSQCGPDQYLKWQPGGHSSTPIPGTHPDPITKWSTAVWQSFGYSVISPGEGHCMLQSNGPWVPMGSVNGTQSYLPLDHCSTVFGSNQR